MTYAWLTKLGIVSTVLCAVACGGGSATVEAPENDVEPIYWIPSSVPGLAQIDVSRLRRSPFYKQLVDLWQNTAYFDAKLLRLLETTSVAYVGMGDLDASPDSTFYVVTRGEYASADAVAAVDAMLHSGVLGSAALSVSLQPDSQGGWSASYGRVRDDGKNLAHLEELSPGVWAMSVGSDGAIRASTTPAPPSNTHIRLMDEAKFAAHTVSFVADTTQVPGDFLSTTLTLDVDGRVEASSRQRAKEGISPEPHAERLRDQLSQAALAAALAGFGSVKDMASIRAEGDVLKIDVAVPQDVAAKAVDMLRSFVVPAK